MKIESACNLWTDQPFLKVGLYGQTGAGKTHWASLAPRPLFLLTEEQALATIATIHPDAHVCVVETWQDVIDALTSVTLASSKTSKAGQRYCTSLLFSEPFQTVVIDSVTDLQELFIRDVIGADPADAYRTAGGGQMSLQSWGRLINVTQQIMRDLRAAPCNVIATMLMTESVIEVEGGSYIRRIPALFGKRLPTSIGQYLNALGYVTQDSAGHNVVLWHGGDRFVTKPAPGWPRKTITPTHAGAPGVTLGSLALRTCGDLPSVPRTEHDSADHVPTDTPDFDTTTDGDAVTTEDTNV